MKYWKYGAKDDYMTWFQVAKIAGELNEVDCHVVQPSGRTVLLCFNKCWRTASRLFLK